VTNRIVTGTKQPPWKGNPKMTNLTSVAKETARQWIEQGYNGTSEEYHCTAEDLYDIPEELHEEFEKMVREELDALI
jgi:hypothetical protein